MRREHGSILATIGNCFTAMGAVVSQYAPTVLGFALTLAGLWLERRERRARDADHRRQLAELADVERRFRLSGVPFPAESGPQPPD